MKTDMRLVVDDMKPLFKMHFDSNQRMALYAWADQLEEDGDERAKFIRGVAESKAAPWDWGARSNPEGIHEWRWQTKWPQDNNYIDTKVYNRLTGYVIVDGTSGREWKCYTKLSEALLDLASAKLKVENERKRNTE